MANSLGRLQISITKIMLYFGYGSNMCFPRLLSRVKSAQFLEVARIEGQRLEFYKRSESGNGASGKATLIAKEENVVFGGLFSLDEQDIGGLRQAEGYPDHYSEKRVQVATLSGTKEAMTYIATEAYFDVTQVPYDWYVDLIRFGGRRIGLPEDYISRFDAVATKPDPDEARSKRERAYLDEDKAEPVARANLHSRHAPCGRLSQHCSIRAQSKSGRCRMA